MARKKLWGGRFAADEDPLFKEFNDSLPFDRELLEADVAGSLAYARALERAGVFGRKDRLAVEKGLRAVLDEALRNPQAVAESGAEDVHSYVEGALADKVGALALKLHTGRSRNDQVATDLRLHLKRREGEIAALLDGFLRVLGALAARHPHAVIPGYTHLQRAQPVLFAHYILAYGEMFLRDRDRLRDALRRIDVCPLGSGAISGTVYPVGREELARDLGFASASANSMDAVADRDFALDFLFFASALAMHLSRLAEDFILYNSSEFAFVQMDDSVSSGSSLMPQKKNPDALELLRGKAGRVYGHLVALLTVLKGLPMTYNKDLQEDKEGLFDAVRTVDQCLRMACRVFEKVSIREERMRSATALGYLNATELADYLVAKGMPFREAHGLVGKVVMRASELDVPLEELPLEEYRGFSPLFGEDLYGCLTLETVVGRRRERGGTAPGAVRQALAQFRKRIGRG
ncbi:MAG: argininosuccinate lyase [Acidobacteriota bacterium]|jgi:argininosuccinate lyase|nr:argininosuccinate lyase [Acidobacteriota bacterium]